MDFLSRFRIKSTVNKSMAMNTDIFFSQFVVDFISYVDFDFESGAGINLVAKRCSPIQPFSTLNNI